MRHCLRLAALLGALGPPRPASAAPDAPQPPLALWAAPARAYCDAAGQVQPAPPLGFLLPGAAAAPEGKLDPGGPGAAPPVPGCDPSLPRALPLEAAAALLGRPLQEGARYRALYPDGHTAEVEVRCAAVGEGGAVLLGRAPCEGTAGAAPPGPAPEGGAAPPGCPTEPGALALLLQPGEPSPQRRTELSALPGIVRRRIGRQSLPARGRLVGPGMSIAAVFKRKGNAIQLAVFGEDGALRLHQSVPWRPGGKVAAKPTAVYLVSDLSEGRDGLLVVGSGAQGRSVHLLLSLSPGGARAYP